MKLTKAASKHARPQMNRKSSAAAAPSRIGCRQQPTGRKLEIQTLPVNRISLTVARRAPKSEAAAKNDRSG
jgi:hypothetical protein